MRWAKYSRTLTLESRKAGRLLDLRSKIGLRPDGTQFWKLYGVDISLQRERVSERDRGMCGGCGIWLALDERELDHIIPRGRGGDDSLSNLQLLGGPFSACKCHRGKKGSKHA